MRKLWMKVRRAILCSMNWHAWNLYGGQYALMYKTKSGAFRFWRHCKCCSAQQVWHEA